MQSRDGTRCLLSSTYCPFCADRHELRVIQEQDTDPFSLDNLLPAGTIPVTVHDGELPCPSASDRRDWYPLPIQSLSAHPVDTLFRELAFLTKHLFLRTTCRLGLGGRIIFIRVYLIPNDLPNVRGQLHRRPVAVVNGAQRHLHNIIPLIERNGGLWNADEGSLGAPKQHLLPNYVDNRTMAEIYSDLPSPELGPVMNENTRLSHRVASGHAIWGLRTTLYPYQRHSVAVMLYRESSITPAPDPLYISVSTMFGTYFYVRPSTMTVLQECPMFSPPRAGILCEELGTGKTVMIIALVLVTASQLADPEESMDDKRSVLTPLAYRHFPSVEHALARKRAGLDRIAIRQLPSLTELLIDHFSSVRVTTDCPAFASELGATHLWPFIRANKAFYHHYDPEPAKDASKRSSHRAAPNLVPRTVYLSLATLVIVPLPLLGQWKTEIGKHCHDCVRYLIVRTSTDLPDARKLASDYELVIMSNSRFCEESKKNKTQKLYDLKPCACPYLAGSRIPDCHCRGDPDVTPLLQVRWKRLVIDEGHNTGNLAAAINYFVQQLSIQYKWIVTGTPTSNTLGLQLGRNIDEELNLVYPDSDPPAVMSSYPDEALDVRIWGNYDRVNLRKLGTMITNFLTVPRFRGDLESFRLHVVIPLCDRRGPRPGAISVLNQVMQMVMVRHRIEDVEDDVLLPPTKHDIIYMNLNSYALTSYNAMQASIVINAIDSEREGTDYLFHPSKAKDLQATINNSSQGLFWSASDILYNVDQICDLADEYVARAIRRQVCPEELHLLQRALEHASAAAKNRMWRAMQPYPDVPFKVSGVDPDVFEAWTRTGLRRGSRTIDIMHPDRLISLRSLVRTKPLISRDELVEEGNIHDRNEQRRVASKTISSRETKHGTNQIKEMAKEVQGTIEALRERVERMNAPDDDGLEDCQYRVTQVTSIEVAATRVTGPSPLSGAKVGPSLSTKLNYILSEVQQHSVKEKFLIFSDSLLTLFQISEALSLFEIKCLRYTNEEACLLREQCILTFETSDIYRVLLMELRLGARGLNLISASRVIFCEPVWHPDVESQAIKRAHRIGQTRPVIVKTLVIRSTAEEAIIARRRLLRSSDKVPNMTTESGMRQYLQNPRFLTESASDHPADVILSLSDNEAALVDTQSNSCERGSSIVDIVDSDTSTVTARKKVRFEG